MLKELCIQNIAIAENVSVEFGVGLNVITGETGAGKSILVEALSLLRGSKADVSLIRTGSEHAHITASFDIKKNNRIRKLIDEIGVELEDNKNEVVIRKTLSRSGKHKSYINDVPIQTRTLQLVASELIDISSQFENQRLLDEASHTFFLDHFINAAGISEMVAEKYRATNELLKLISNLDDEIVKQKRELALHKYETEEIESAELDAAEWEEIQSVLNLGTKAAQGQKACADVLSALSEADNSCVSQLKYCLKQLERLYRLAGESKLPVKIEDFREALAMLEDLSFSVHRAANVFDIDEERVAQAETRVEIYNKLLSKFGPTLQDVFDYLEKSREFLSQNSTLEERRNSYVENAVTLIKETVELAHKLSKKRRDGVSQIAKSVELELAELGMPKTKFVCRLEPAAAEKETRSIAALEGELSAELLKDFLALSKTGFERAHFLMSANVGIEPQPIEKIASGGELSRVMLAIKNVLFSDAALSVFVFDEIDTGVSGQIAAKIGKKLSEFCSSRQSICITHLPQVACYAHAHYIASKRVVNQKTTAQIVRANESERLTELAKMLSGEKVTQESLAQAKRLATEAKQVGR